ncbi:MAG TPA: type VI secretion system membrane subunit TssM [Steroidobacteraceae bacterium]|nr:type VI secretion system membrane subunit TssM [Steroidobacteraceae bacterium]
MVAFLKSRTFLVIIGLLILSLLIWFAGPYFAFADYRPLESVLARVITIVVIFVIWAFVVLLKKAKSNSASAKLASDMASQEGGKKEGADAQQLRKRFDEAIDALKRSRTKGAKNLYELPWYIIIGPPGSGKTTALVNSGLNFPLAQKFGKEALRGVGGTRNCDWWFTDDAILLDTAGRYTTQDSNESADSAGWVAFLQLLKKHRSRQPINGVLVAISASDLLTLNEREREKHVVAIRERLEELNRHLKISVPVYFLVTKCDLIAGFSEYFDDFGTEARAQVWGMTFPIEATESGKAVDSFDAEFDGLLQRLQSRVLSRIEQDRDARRRATLLAFPQQTALLKPLLGDLLKRVFGDTGYDSKVMLRGVYLTSGTQEGTPIDRMLGAIARSFGVTAAVSAAPAGQGKSYFIQRLLKNVIFAESGLAGINRRLQLQKIFLQSFAYIACVAVLVIGVVLMVVSYNRNANHIAEVEKAAVELKSLEPTRGEQPVESFLPHLNELRNVVAIASEHEDSVPLTMRFGLYRGGALTEAARDAYIRELNQVLVPVLARQFEARLRDSAQAPDKLYEYLKGYLMLEDSSHRDLDHLRALSGLVFGQALGRDPQAREEIDAHFGVLLEDEDRIHASVVNKDIVDQARYSLSTASLPYLMYSRLKQGHQGDDKNAVRLSAELGAGADAALSRKSGEKLGSVIPAIYTRNVFQDVNKNGKYGVVKDFAADQWVFGDKVFDLSDAGKYAFDIMRVYERDYIEYYDRQLADVQIKPTSNSRELADVLGIISSPSSPLKRFLEIVADQTNLLKVDPKDAVDKLEDKVTKPGSDALARALGITESPDAVKPGAECTAHFEAIRKLVDGPPGGTQLDRVQGVLKDMHAKMKATGTGVGDTNALDMVAGGGADALQSIQLEAKQLPPPLDEMMAKIGGQSEGVVEVAARDELAQRYNELVLRQCRELIEGRYPFARGSSNDLPLGDFGQVFGSGGVFDTFFQGNLKQLVDTTRTPWRWREGAPAGSAAMLRQFQLVEKIREVFFRAGSQQPEVRFNVSPSTLDASVARFAMDVDGQLFEYRHGPQQSRSIVWPGANGVGQASVLFEDRGGSGPALRFKGAWSLFRLLDQAKVTRDSDTSFSAAFSVDGRNAEITLDANSVRNPFGRPELLRFRCAM